jgi:hypothetical protein
MNECIFIPLIVLISLRSLDIRYRDNNLISPGLEALRETIVLGVPPFGLLNQQAHQ